MDNNLCFSQWLYRRLNISCCNFFSQQNIISITFASLLFCNRELAIGLSCTDPAHSPTPTLPPLLLHASPAGVTPGSRVGPVQVLPEGSAPATVHRLQLPSRQLSQQLASLRDLLLAGAARGGLEEFLLLWSPAGREYKLVQYLS